MAVPDFQSIMLPLLMLAEDNEVHSFHDAISKLATHFRLSDEDKREKNPNSNNLKFNNRVGWAKTHLSKAGLIESAGVGKFKITKIGLNVLKQNPPVINMKFLGQFDSYKRFVSPNSTETKIIHKPVISEQTPLEILGSTYQTLKLDLAQELLENLKKCSPAFFEKIVVDLLLSMGYGGALKDAGQVVGKSGDGGIDGIIKEDKLGLDIIYIQAKRWEGTVGSNIVNEFAGSLMVQGASKGVLITTSKFSQDAKKLHNKAGIKIVLIDGEQLAELMIEHNIGVTIQETFVVKKLDVGYFELG